METRFTKDVWPKIARFLGSIIQSESHRGGLFPEAASLHVETRCWETEACNMSDSEQQLILSMLDCLGRVCRVVNLPEGVLSSVALILLPLLDTGHFGADIGEKAMVSAKYLADTNCDVLWRPLLRLLGAYFPPFPINFSEFAHLTTAGVRLPSDQTVLPRKATELLIYINCLPEQGIY